MLKYIQVEGKSEKCLRLLKGLLTTNDDKLTRTQIIDILHNLVSLPPIKYGKEVADIYAFCKNIETFENDEQITKFSVALDNAEFLASEDSFAVQN